MPGGAIRTVTIALWPNIIEDHCGNGDTNQNANWSQTHIGTESADDDQRYLRLVKVTLVIERLDQVASRIVNANHHMT
jgi:hypothetical protein